VLQDFTKAIGLVLFLAVITAHAVCRCSASQVSTEARVLTITAQACEQIARDNGRDDIATVCHLTESVAPVLSAALMPADAGAE
jgi:hypothetical protein